MAWFRGAAASVSLDIASKSVVAYGENGAGKSSFVDAVEFLMSGGKIRHLAHEYSGKRQEKGIINTHTPKGEKAKLELSVAGGAAVKAEIEQSGKYSCSGIDAVDGWDYRRTILRQDEVAAFIHGTKGDKYSALLPLFGLHPLELAAENIRQLAKEVARQFQITQIRDLLAQVDINRRRVFGDSNDAQISAKIDVRPVAEASRSPTLKLKSGLSASAAASAGVMEKGNSAASVTLPSVEIYTDGECETNPGPGGANCFSPPPLIRLCHRLPLPRAKELGAVLLHPKTTKRKETSGALSTQLGQFLR